MFVRLLAERFWAFTSRQRMLMAGFVSAAVAIATEPSAGVLTLVVRVSLWLVLSVLLMRTFEIAHPAPFNSRAVIAYLPVGCAPVAFELSKVFAPHAVLSGSLDDFFSAAASLLGLLLISLVVETRRVAPYDKWLLALRGWWVMFIVLGILYALAGLTPGHSRKALRQDYEWVWAGLAGAVAALTVVMWRDPTARHEVRDPHAGAHHPNNWTPVKARIIETTTVSTATTTATRTQERSTKA